MNRKVLIFSGCDSHLATGAVGVGPDFLVISRGPRPPGPIANPPGPVHRPASPRSGSGRVAGSGRRAGRRTRRSSRVRPALARGGWSVASDGSAAGRAPPGLNGPSADAPVARLRSSGSAPRRNGAGRQSVAIDPSRQSPSGQPLRARKQLQETLSPPETITDIREGDDEDSTREISARTDSQLVGSSPVEGGGIHGREPRAGTGRLPGRTTTGWGGAGM